MVIDTSALLAVLLDEADAEHFEAAIARASRRLMSTVSILETGIVIERRYGEIGTVELDRILHRAEIEAVPFTLEHCDLARQAFRNFGKGRHPAGLNFGDCAAYALSCASGEPLLFKGNDFARTDVIRA